MWKRFSDWLRHISSGWLTLTALLVFLTFSTLVLPRQATSSETNTADAGTPDLSFYYSSSDLYRMAEAYGEAGRDAYIWVRFTFDLLWPLVYTFFLTTAISWLYAKTFFADSRWQLANLVPLLGMLFDYMENISTSLVMFRYPGRTPVVDWLAPLFTSLKWILITGSFVLLSIGLMVTLWEWINRGSNKR